MMSIIHLWLHTFDLRVLGCGMLNLSSKSIRKLDKTIMSCTNETNRVISLNISGNCLQRLDNIDMFPELMEVSAIAS